MPAIRIKHAGKRHIVRLVAGRRSKGVKPVRDHQGIQLRPGDAVDIVLLSPGKYELYYVYLFTSSEVPGAKVPLVLQLSDRAPVKITLETTSHAGPGGASKSYVDFPVQSGASKPLSLKFADISLKGSPSLKEAPSLTFVWGTRWQNDLPRTTLDS